MAVGGFVWGYAMAWFVFNDVMKMMTLRVLRKRGVVH